MKKIIVLTLLLSGAFVLSGCSPYGSVPSNSSNTDIDPALTQGVSTVNIQNFAFSPEVLTISKGTAVTWVNGDSVPHQIRSATFNSDLLNKGQIFSFTFDTVGTFDYSCAIHPSMSGKIIVE